MEKQQTNKEEVSDKEDFLRNHPEFTDKEDFLRNYPEFTEEEAEKLLKDLK